MTNSAKLPKDFKLFQIRVLDVCPACNGSGLTYRKPIERCAVCKGSSLVTTVLHEGVTLDILLAKVFEDASKKKLNELIIEES